MPTFTAFHVAIGFVALLAGVAGLVTKKGSLRHLTAGKVFVSVMLVMTASGIVLGVLMPSYLATLLGILTIYLVLTSWVSARSKTMQVGWFDYLAVVSMALTCAWGISLGAEAAASETGFIEVADIPARAYYIVAGVAGFFGFLDLLVILRGGVTGKHRIARHLWRMCFAFLIAAQAVFVGQPQFFPDFMRSRVLLSLPLFGIIGAMLYWLDRTLRSKH